MSMGGGYSDVRPVSRSSYRPSTDSADPEPARPAASRRREDEPAPANIAPDYTLPIYVSVGGGLSHSRIVAKLPEELNGAKPQDNTLQQTLKYMVSPEVAHTDEYKAVAANVRDRIELPDCRLMVNNALGLGTPYNLGREHIEDKLGEYLVKKTMRTGNGDVNVNYCDIAIVTHDEGGNAKARAGGLEKLVA